MMAKRKTEVTHLTQQWLTPLQFINFSWRLTELSWIFLPEFLLKSATDVDVNLQMLTQMTVDVDIWNLLLVLTGWGWHADVIMSTTAADTIIWSWDLGPDHVSSQEQSLQFPSVPFYSKWFRKSWSNQRIYSYSTVNYWSCFCLKILQPSTVVTIDAWKVISPHPSYPHGYATALNCTILYLQLWYAYRSAVFDALFRF